MKKGAPLVLTVVYMSFILVGCGVLPARSTPNIPQNDSSAVDSNVSPVYTIQDGDTGKYGEYVELGGEQFINYHIPSGTYRVELVPTSAKNSGVIYVVSDKYTTDIEGRVQSKLITVKGVKSGMDETITVGDGEHLETSEGAEFRLTFI